eukprot:5806656-Alexandrium_andersonii.AAC.1
MRSARRAQATSGRPSKREAATPSRPGARLLRRREARAKSGLARGCRTGVAGRWPGARTRPPYLWKY